MRSDRESSVLNREKIAAIAGLFQAKTATYRKAAIKRSRISYFVFSFRLQSSFFYTCICSQLVAQNPQRSATIKNRPAIRAFFYSQICTFSNYTPTTHHIITFDNTFHLYFFPQKTFPCRFIGLISFSIFKKIILSMNYQPYKFFIHL